MRVERRDVSNGPGQVSRRDVLSQRTRRRGPTMMSRQPTPARTARTALPSLVGLVLLNSCSWIAVTPAPHDIRASQEPTCTESVAAPVVDTVFAVAYATLAISSLIGLAQQHANDCNATQEFCINLDFTPLFAVTAIATGAAAVVHGASAAYGYPKTAKCRSTRSTWRQTQRVLEAESPTEVDMRLRQ